jgi:recombination associated protein RdgC
MPHILTLSTCQGNMMWFRQLQLYQYTNTTAFTQASLLERLEPLAFNPCPPSMLYTMGWVSPVDEDDAPLIRAFNGYMMLCLQIEEKILPATVIRKELADKVKQIELAEGRKLRQSEKNTLKDEIIINLVPRAFSRFTKIFGYLDTKKHWLILSTTNTKKADFFISMLKKCIAGEFTALEIKELPSTMTRWLTTQEYPRNLSVEKACLLRDPNQTNRVIRCQQQDLFAPSIQALLKDGCEVMQIALCWQDRVNFVVSNDFTLRSLSFQEEIISAVKDLEAETKQQQFDADFLLMTETFTALINDLLAGLHFTEYSKVASL